MNEGKRTWKTWHLVAAVAVAFVLGVAAGAGTPEDDEKVSASGQAEQSSTTRETSHVQASTTPTVPPPTPPPTVATITTAPGPKTEFGNGTHRVGVDIAPGTYVAPGGAGCYWERQSVFGGGGVDSIIANEFAPNRGQVVVTIAATDKGFRTSGCGTWKRG